MKKILFSLFLLSSLAQAGNLRGNGGKGVVCPGKPVRFFDVLRGEDDWDLKQDVALGNNYLEMAEYYVNRLAAFDPKRVDLMKGFLKTFTKESRFYQDYNLFMIDDSSEVGIPKGCKLELIINQIAPQFPKDARYRINKDLWDQLVDAEKAALVLHEIVIREKLDHYGLKDESFNKDEVSYFVANIVSTDLSTLSLGQYRALGDASRTRYSFWDQFIFGGFKYDKGGEYYSAQVHIYDPKFTYSSGGTMVKVVNASYLAGNGVSMAFYPSGRLLEIFNRISTPPLNIEVTLATPTGTDKVKLEGKGTFYESGALFFGTVTNTSKKLIVLKGPGGLDLKPGQSVRAHFSPNGEVVRQFDIDVYDRNYCRMSDASGFYPDKSDSEEVCISRLQKVYLNIDLPQALIDLYELNY